MATSCSLKNKHLSRPLCPVCQLPVLRKKIMYLPHQNITVFYCTGDVELGVLGNYY